MREFYSYKFQIGADDNNHILRFDRLLQQYSVEDEIRQEFLQGIVDVVGSGEHEPSNIGQRIVLPGTMALAQQRKMLKDYAFIDPAILLPPPAEEDAITVHEALSVLPWRKTAWVIGKTIFTPRNQGLWVFKCSGCGEESGVEPRSRV